MANKIVECVANYSEARRPEVVEQIKQSISSVPGVVLLDQHSDMDHNRTVLTFVGEPASVEEAAFRAIATAGDLINLDEHEGEHPRLGATDVVPFVPIRGVTMDECVQMAQRLGSRVGKELYIPVYLYEEAAATPARHNLEDIRRGEYETLKDEIASNPDREPDYGPRRMGTAGATVIGARNPLIAFNVYLDTDDVSVARKIAKAVRHSSGGLRFVKALGLEVEGLAQVSMNLTNYHRTPVARVVELIRREAERYGTRLHHSELVGLIPQDALVEAAQWYLQLDQFEPDQILEYRLAAAQSESPGSSSKEGTASTEKMTDFLDALASGEATPGGGSAAALSGAAGAALVAMVARLTIGKKKYAAVEAEMQTVLERAEELRTELTAAIQQDIEAFDAVMDAFRLPKHTEEQKAERSQAIESTTMGAAEVPLEVGRMAVEVIEQAAIVVKSGNVNAICDGATAAALARAALDGGGYNVRVNAINLKDKDAASYLLERLEELEQRAVTLEIDIRGQLVERGGFSLG